MNLQNLIWTEKYRPSRIEDCILPEQLKTTFLKFIEQNHVPNLLLSGSPGVGKTSVAKALLEQLGCDYIVINGSLNGNIDTLRTEIQQFASTISFSGGRKYVILDEADYLNPNSTQPALRNFMEEYSKNCGFILTCNFKNRIIEALQSRCAVIDFNISKSDIPVLATQFMKRLMSILDENSITYDKSSIAEVIKIHFPDWRRIINEIQTYSVTGRIDSGILVNFSDENFNKLIGYMKEKKFNDVRRWVAENTDMDSSVLFRKFYDLANEKMEKDSIPQLILHLARYQFQNSFVADQEINIVAFLLEIMVDCHFK